MNTNTINLTSGTPILVNGAEAEFIERKGGWTTIMDENGKTRKVRNGQVEPIEAAETPKAEKKEYTLAEAKAEESGEASTDEDDEPKFRRIVKAKYDPARYVTHEEKTESGRRCIDNDDDAAALIRKNCSTLDDVYEFVAEALATADNQDAEEVEDELRAKYGHLNPGMQRMNLGNRFRGTL